MNKILSASLLIPVLVVLSLSLTACGKDEQEKPVAEKPVSEQVTQPVEPPKESAPPAIPAEPLSAEAPTDTTIAAEEPATSPILQQDSRSKDQMLALAKKSGCLACHSVDKKLVGPAWKGVAARYRGNADARAQLIEKVSKGGKDNWKDITGGVPMPPYFPRVTKENIERLVDFVLSL